VLLGEFNPGGKLPYTVYEKLIGFNRVHLEAGEKKMVIRELSIEWTAIYDVNQHRFVVEPGVFEVMAGSSSKDIRSRGQYEVRP
jgi:beta-glucosidase